MKPVILVTRKLPDAVEERLLRTYDARLNPGDVLYSSDELIRRAEGADAILPCHTEKFTAEVIARLPKSVRAIANFSVGYDHVDCKAAKEHGLIVTNTPGVLSDATAELTIGFPVAMYSNALVGLINSVASFSANGIRQTSNSLQ